MRSNPGMSVLSAATAIFKITKFKLKDDLAEKDIPGLSIFLRHHFRIAIIMSWTCPKCDRELPWKDYRHYCQRVSPDTLFEGRSPELVLAFDKILAEVADWEKVLVGVTPNCIVFTRRVGFLIIRQ